MLSPEFQALHEKIKGKLVLDFPHGIALCRGIIDGQDDYYYDLLYWNGDKGSVSCVGWMYDLSEYFPAERYAYMVEIWNLNIEEQADVPNKESQAKEAP